MLETQLLRHVTSVVVPIILKQHVLVESGSEARGNHHNQVVVVNRGQRRGNNDNQAHEKAFMLRAERLARTRTSTLTLNNHYGTTLFDSGFDYSFVFTTFIPLLGIKPCDLGFSYEIEIASGQLVDIDKENEFRIELVPEAIPVAKSPYGLAPSEMEELSGQLKEL
nr:reverse transcriptase domain-containing protein [Tanacetum cinerariifolium]